MPQGIVHIQASFNNTLVAITDLEGNLISQSSAGALGFHGSERALRSRRSRLASAPLKPRASSACTFCEVRVKGRARAESRPCEPSSRRVSRCD